jgi:hypothetical protein
MKTWEVLKNLDAGATKRYRRLGDGLEISLGGQLGMYYRWESGHTHLSPLDKWEEIPQEVAWQEAIEAWANGKIIKCTARGYDNIYQQYDVVDDCYDSFLLDEVGNPLDAYEILEGKWYIEEGAPHILVDTHL